MPENTRPDPGQKAPCASKTARIIAALADGPRTLADLKAITRDPHSLILDAREKGAVIRCDRKADPPTYHLERMPDTPEPRVKPERKPKAAPRPKPTPPLKGWLSARSFETLTGLPASALPLRWSAGKFPAAVIFERLADAAESNPAYRNALAMLAAGAGNHG